MDERLKKMIVLPSALLVTVAIIMLRAGCAQVLYTWYVEPLGAPHIGLCHMAGLTALLSALSSDVGGKEKTAKESVWIILNPFLSLFIGWLIKVVFL